MKHCNNGKSLREMLTSIVRKGAKIMFTAAYAKNWIMIPIKNNP
jgi:hypothetical protein